DRGHLLREPLELVHRHIEVELDLQNDRGVMNLTLRSSTRRAGFSVFRARESGSRWPAGVAMLDPTDGRHPNRTQRTKFAQSPRSTLAWPHNQGAGENPCQNTDRFRLTLMRLHSAPTNWAIQ